MKYFLTNLSVYQGSYNIVDLIFITIGVITIYTGWVRGMRASIITSLAIILGLITSKLFQKKIFQHINNLEFQKIGALVLVIFGGMCGYLVGNMIANFLGKGESEGLGGWCSRISGAIIHTSAFLLATWLLCLNIAGVSDQKVQQTIASSVTMKLVNSYAPNWLQQIPGEVAKEVFYHPDDNEQRK